MKKKTIGNGTVLFFLLFGTLSMYAQEGVQVKSSLNWTAGKLLLSFSIDISQEGIPVINGRRNAERKMQDNLTSALEKHLRPICIDSYNTFGDIIHENPSLIDAINNMLDTSLPEKTYLSEDLHTFHGEYSFDLYSDIVSLLDLHSVPKGIGKRLTWVPTSGFSGLIIYMKGTYPVHGSDEQGNVVPCLLPRIFDEQMDLVLDPGMMDPKGIKTWGVCAYSDTTDEKEYQNRTGLTPLRISGTGIFGKNHTDIIISREDADKLLYLKENRDLLAEGKIVIICDLDTP